MGKGSHFEHFLLRQGGGHKQQHCGKGTIIKTYYFAIDAISVETISQPTDRAQM